MAATRRVFALREMAVSTKTVAAVLIGVTAVPGRGTFSAQGWPGLNTVASGPRAEPSHAPVPGAVCGTVQASHAGCFATMVSTSCSSGAKTTTDPCGYWPAELNAAYLRYSGTSPTLAVDGAFDDLGAQRNLAVHRSGSGPPPCTTTNGCSRKREQRKRGTGPSPRAGSSWAIGIRLDLGAASATQPEFELPSAHRTRASVHDPTAQPGWVVGGSSLAAPLVAGPAANTAHGVDPGGACAHTQRLRDITSATTGTCSPLYVCTTAPGHDGPTGLGPPAGPLSLGARVPLWSGQLAVVRGVGD